MTQGTEPARRDLWEEQGLRPARRPAPQAAGATPHDAAAPAQTPARAPAAPPAPVAAPVPADVPDDVTTRIDSDVLDRARERRDLPGRRAARWIGAVAALTLVGGGAWTILHDRDPAVPPPPTPTLAAEDLATLLASLEGSTTDDGLPVLGAIPDVPISDPRRADLLQPAPAVDVSLRSAQVRWALGPAELLDDIAKDAGVKGSDLDGLAVVPARMSASVADASAPEAVVVVQRGSVGAKVWRALLDAADAPVKADRAALVVAVDTAAGRTAWVAPLEAPSASPCQVLDAGTFVACETVTEDGEGLREIVVLEAATGAVDARVPVPTACRVTSLLQHTGVLYWAGLADDLACLGSGSTLLSQWFGQDAPTLALTHDGRILARSSSQSLVRSTDGTWRSFSGAVEPGPDGTLLRSFLREELTALGPLALRDTPAGGSTAVATRWVTFVSAEDGTTISALPGAAWRRDDLITSTGVSTPAMLEDRTGVGDWIVSASGARERLVHAGAVRFGEQVTPWVAEAGIAGAPATEESAEGLSLLVVGSDGRPVAGVADLSLVARPYGGGRVGPALDDADAEPVPGVGAPAPEQSDGMEFLDQAVSVVGVDGARRTTRAVVPMAFDDDVRAFLPPDAWVATGGVVVLPIGPTLVGIG